MIDCWLHGFFDNNPMILLSNKLRVTKVESVGLDEMKIGLAPCLSIVELATNVRFVSPTAKFGCVMGLPTRVDS